MAKQCVTHLLEGDGPQDQDLLAYAREDLEKAEVSHEEAKDELGAASAAARKLEKNKAHGALTRATRQKIDGLLALYNIKRSSYHGGDMEGNSCRRLIRNAGEVMTAIESALLLVPRADRAKGCDDNEIGRYCQSYCRLFKYMDMISHYAWQPAGKLSDSDITKAKKVVGMADRLWRRLHRNTPPKVHMWQHLIEDLERFRGLKFHNESPIEVAHQTSMKTDTRYKALAGGRSINKKIGCVSQYEANLKDPRVLAEQARIQKERARKLGEKSKANKELRQQEIKMRRLESIDSILDLPEIEYELPSFLDLLVVDRLAVAAEAETGGTGGNDVGV